MTGEQAHIQDLHVADRSVFGESPLPTPLRLPRVASNVRGARRRDHLAPEASGTERLRDTYQHRACLMRSMSP
jgi:hypothetical protein